ncbi:MAG: NYN domain-containing protein [Planctomycetota bacterium]
MAENDSAQVGLLLDFENLVIPFQKKSAYKPGSLPLAPVIDFLEENFGNVIFRRAYADWSNPPFKAYERTLQDMGVEMIHVCRRTRASKKNGADILLTADAVECLLLRPFITDYAIVSGDSDIGPLVTKLKSHGKTVIVIGPDKESTAKHVIELADRFKFYADIAQPPSERPSTRGRRSRLSPEMAVVRILEERNEAMESASLKRELCSQPGFADFNQKAFGFRTWTSFLRSIDGVVIQHRSDLGVEVDLRD